MVFSSVPVYLDPPSNWNQQEQQQQISNNQLPTNSIGIVVPHEIHRQVPTMFPVPPPDLTGMSVATTSVRPSSLPDRARVANLPQPEHGLKCPRCESTNTKFCYYNNYSLSQPRHFCKACKRYWTRGGALRNVPVGGGYRRNKRNKSSSSKSNANSSSSSTTPATVGAIGSNTQPQARVQLPFVTSLNPLAHDQFSASSLGLGFSRIHHPLGHNSVHDHQYNQLENIGSTSVAGSLSLEHHHQWRLPQITQQFPNFIGGSGGNSHGLYSFDGDESSEGNFSSQAMPKLYATATGTSSMTSMGTVKTEDNNGNQNNHHGLISLPTQYLGLEGNNNDGGWSTGNLRGFSSSSTGDI